jgi:hypothetical protein
MTASPKPANPISSTANVNEFLEQSAHLIDSGSCPGELQANYTLACPYGHGSGGGSFRKSPQARDSALRKLGIGSVSH